MTCKKCNNIFADMAKFCPKCGTKVEDQVAVQNNQMKKCPKCGAENSLTAKFCRRDGYKFEPSGDASVVSERAESSNKKLVCPKCNAAYPATAKFCRKDGTPLVTKPVQNNAEDIHDKNIIPDMNQAQTSQIEQAAKEAITESPETEDVPSKTPVKIQYIIVAALIIIALSGIAGYLYFSGASAKNPSKIEEKINADLKQKGLAVTVSLSKDWIATIQGNAKDSAEKDSAIEIIRNYKQIRNIADISTIALQENKSDAEIKKEIEPVQQKETESPSAVQKTQPVKEQDMTDQQNLSRIITDDLRDNGFGNIRVSLQSDYTAIITGSARNESAKERAVSLVRSYSDVKGIRNKIEVK